MTITDAQRNRNWLVIVLVLVLAAVARLLSFRGYITYDAAEYARLAHMMLSGEFRTGMMWFFPVFSTRVGLFAPVALAFRLGGVNEVALTAYPFLLSLLGVIVAHLAGRAMFGLRAGFAAALLAALLPIDARFASTLLPDMPAAFWMNAGVLLAYAGSRQDTVSGRAWLGALAGFALFASWLCKEAVLFLLPFIGLYLLWLAVRDRRNIALLLATLAAAALCVGLECWVYHRHTGDWLFRFHALARNFEGVGQRIPFLSAAWIDRYLVRRAGLVLRETFLNAHFAFIPAAALLACAWAAFRRDRRFLFPALWFGWLLLMFGFGSASLKSYVQLNLVLSRFQYPLLLPAVLLTAGLVTSLLAPRGPQESDGLSGRRLIGGVLLAAFLAAASLTMLAWNTRTGLGRACKVEREMARVLKPADRVYTDCHTALALRFFWQYPPACSARAFEEMARPQPLPGAYVLLNRDELDRMRRVSKYAPPGFCDSVPPAWQRIRDVANATLYLVPPDPGPK